MKKAVSLILAIIITSLMIPTAIIGANAEDKNSNSGYIPDDIPRLIDDNYDGGSFSGYVPDDEKRLTGDDDDTEPTTQTEKAPVKLTDAQKQQITAMMDVAKWYTANDSVGNPVAPPYDEAYTTEMGMCSDRIMDYGNQLLCDTGDFEQFCSVNSDYAHLLSLLENPIINPQFAAYTCYLSFKENNNNNWYEENDWKQFVAYRNELYNALTDVNENYLNINANTLTFIQKKEITDAFFDLLEHYDKMTLDNALLGDMNGDGYVTIFDVTEMQRNLAGMVEFTEGQKLRASTRSNATKNGPNYDITSATTLQKYLVGMGCDEFEALQMVNFPPKEICPTHAHYPDPEILNQRKYRNVSIWNPIICITDYSDKRLSEIEQYFSAA